MKALWNILAVVAIANVVAVALLAVWLISSDRLDKGRVERVRQMLAMTIAEELAASEVAKIDAERAEAEAIQAERMAKAPVPAVFAIESAQLSRDSELQVDLRRQRELEDLRMSLLRLQQGLEEREAALARKVQEFESSKRLYASIEGAEQFKTALGTLEGQRPRDAKAVLEALLTIGQHEQVTAYLANMDESKRSKVVAEFVKDNPPVAAELLESLRTRGVTSSDNGVTGVAPDAQPRSSLQ